MYKRIDASSVLNRHLWKANYEVLLNKGVANNRAEKFARGLLALSGHIPILNGKGRELLEFGQAILKSMEGISSILDDHSVESNIRIFNNKTPSVSNPRLSLFVSPSNFLSTNEKDALLRLFNEEHIDGIRALQVTSGCASHCLMCGLDAPFKMIHMPYPMILAVAKEFISPHKDINTYHDSDPLHYRDIYFDADYGDVVRVLRGSEYSLHDFSHGWWGGDKYAQRAAQKMREDNYRITTLSMHLFHQEVLGNIGNPEKLSGIIDEFRQRFSEAIQLLRPQYIRFQHAERDKKFAGKMGKEFEFHFIRSLYDGEHYFDWDNWDSIVMRASGRGIALANELKKYGLRLSEGRNFESYKKSVIFKPWGEVRVIKEVWDDGQYYYTKEALSKRVFHGTIPLDIR